MIYLFYEKASEINKEPCNIILLGDFNIPIIQWPSGRSSGGSLEDQQQARALSRLMDNLYLDQVILEPTQNQNILDLVFINNTDIIHSYSVLKTVYSDHNMIEVAINTFSSKNKAPAKQQPSSDEQTLRKLNFFSSRVNWELLDRSLKKVKWNDLLKPDVTVTEMLDIFLNQCKTKCEPVVPKRMEHKNKIPCDRWVLMRSRRKLQKTLQSQLLTEEAKKKWKPTNPEN